MIGNSKRKTPDSNLGGDDQGLSNDKRRYTCALYDVDHHTLESLKGQDVYLTEVSERDSKWDAKKRQTENVSQLYAKMEDFKSQAFRTANCADRLGFNFGEDGKLKLQRAWFCRCRLCPTCQLRRQMKYTAMVYQGLPTLLEEHQGLRYLFVTQTVKNCAYEDTRSTLRWMNKSWDKMSRRKFFKERVLGFIRTTEVKKSKHEDAHPHFHTILAVRPSYFKKHYIKQAEWVQYWRQALKVDYDPGFNVKAINKPYSNAEGDIIAAIKETIKYAVKPGDIEDDAVFLQQMTDQLHKLRFISSGGIFKGLFKRLGIEEETSADLIHLTDENKEKNDGPPAIEFAYNRSIKRYKKDPRHSLV